MDGILILTSEFVILAVILGSYLRRRHTLNKQSLSPVQTRDTVHPPSILPLFHGGSIEKKPLGTV